MIRESISVDEAIAFLNSLVEIDRDAMQRIVENRVPCNESMANHETVQVHVVMGSEYTVGLLGILNGIFGIHENGRLKGWGSIGAYFSADGNLVRFEKIDDQLSP